MDIFFSQPRFHAYSYGFPSGSFRSFPTSSSSFRSFFTSSRSSGSYPASFASFGSFPGSSDSFPVSGSILGQTPTPELSLRVGGSHNLFRASSEAQSGIRQLVLFYPFWGVLFRNKVIFSGFYLEGRLRVNLPTPGLSLGVGASRSNHLLPPVRIKQELPSQLPGAQLLLLNNTGYDFLEVIRPAPATPVFEVALIHRHLALVFPEGSGLPQEKLEAPMVLTTAITKANEGRLGSKPPNPSFSVVLPTSGQPRPVTNLLWPESKGVHHVLIDGPYRVSDIYPQYLVGEVVPPH
ncbi:hypothetical protein Pcinc_025812 [Petrolisthes cinctipes]|uniref:Uncharacterized protein n=1 Tax=Petrolisthes cinctipes TaxID=88211 RepID=A0AAE1F8F6_PETCI|nr:hypothetical protein Pcinc_025812 [Petrolisthes cinctipes]